MKKYLLSLVLAGTALSIVAKSNNLDSCKCENISHSYLSIRPNFQSAMPELVSGFRDDRIHAKENGMGGAVQAVVFGGKTTDSASLRRYFFPVCKECLVVDELGQNSPDLLAANFNIFTLNCSPTSENQDNCFRSKITIDPQQSVIGLGLQYRQSFWQDECAERGFWASVQFPIERVKNTVNLCEDVISDGGGPDESIAPVVVANMKEAFNQSDWNFGKISCNSQSSTNVAGVELKLGYEWLQYEPYHLEAYVGILLPAGDRPKGVYLFEPIVGWGKNTGITMGGNFGFDLWSDDCCEHFLRVENNSHAQYLFSNRQKRSIDLVNKPWSRYLPVYANREQAEEAVNDAQFGATLATPGINVFTQDVNVTPGFMYNFTTALVYTNNCGFQAEVGYNFWSRRSECLTLDCPWKEGPALKAEEGIGFTNPFRTIGGKLICDNAVVDGSCTGELVGPDAISIDIANYEASIIKEEDLDLASAATPCGLSQIVYGALGYQWDEKCYPTFINGGASYEFSRSNNSIPDRWTLWAKIGVSF